MAREGQEGEEEEEEKREEGWKRARNGTIPRPPSLSLFLFHPGFRPQATAHVLLQILVKKLKWIHEWSDTGTHGVSAVAKCATTDDSNRGFFATRARLGRSPNNNSTSSRAGEDDLSSLFDRLAVSIVCFPPTFLFFLSLSLFPFIPSFGFYLSRWRDYSFDEEKKEEKLVVMVVDLSMDEFLRLGNCCPESNCSSC